MWIVERINQKQNYISGIFKEEKDLKKFLSNIRTKYLNDQLIKFENVKYPFYILETINEKLNIHKFTVLQTKKVLSEKEQNSLCYQTIYTITKDFSSLDFGADLMGYLEHEHIDS